MELTEGLTTVLISHRFSSVRRADHIVVIEEGRVVEQGSHSELTASDTRYRRLFELQARRFREGLGADDDADAAVMEGA
jgi:ATP-binding cassette subfamily B protein